MAPLLPMNCDAHGCPFVTHPEAPDFGSQLQQLALHVQAAHPQRHVPDAVQEEARDQRPEARMEMDECEWQKWELEWKEYKQKKGLAGERIIDELWKSMNGNNLFTAMVQSLVGKVPPKNEKEMLSSMKNLAVLIHPRMRSMDLLTSSQPHQFLKTLQGGHPNTSFFGKSTKEINKEIIMCFLLFKFKNEDVLALVRENKMII